MKIMEINVGVVTHTSTHILISCEFLKHIQCWYARGLGASGHKMSNISIQELERSVDRRIMGEWGEVGGQMVGLTLK